MTTFLQFVLSCIFLYSVIYRRLQRKKRYRATAEAKAKIAEEKNNLLESYWQIANTLNVNFVLHSRHIYISVGERDLYDCFVFLTSDGVSFCTESEPENIFTISYVQITRIDFGCNASCSPISDPLKFMSKLTYLRFQLVKSEGQDIIVYFHFSDNEADPEFIFNQQSLQNDNFFAELEKHTYKLYNDVTDVAKIFE